MQDIPTNFGTRFDIVQRFVKSVSSFKHIVSKKIGGASRKNDKQLLLLKTKEAGSE